MTIRRFINVSINNNKHMEAYFEEVRYGLYVERIGSGTVISNDNSINCGNVCYKECDYDEQITLKAIPNSGFNFTGWLGDYDNELANNRCQVRMDSDKTIVAVFCQEGTWTTTTAAPTTTTTTPAPQLHTLTVIKDGPGYVQSNNTQINCGPNCSHQYVHNTQVILLEPIPDTGYEFSHWSGAGAGNENRIILVNSDKEVTAHFTPQQFDLTVEIVGNGKVESSDSTVDCSNLCTYVLDYNTTLTLEAIANLGSQFVDWQINSITETSNPQILTINEDKYVIATFEAEIFTLQVSISGYGNVETSDTLINCPSYNCQQEYVYDSQVILTAIAAQHYSFSHWTGDLTGSENNRSLIIDEDKEVTAVFDPNQYELLVNTEGSGSVVSSPGDINCGSECQDLFDYNTHVTLIATPSTGYSFSHWSGDLISANSTDVIVINSNKSVTAHFIINRYTLSLNVNGEGDVTSADSLLNCPDLNCAQLYDYATSVNLTASHDLHWVFSHWSGDLSGTNPNKSIVINSNKSVTANFVLEQFYLNIDVLGEGTVNVDPGSDCHSSCQNFYDYNTEVSLIAEPDDGWSFSHWSGDLTGSNTEKTIIIDSNQSVTAHFTINQYYLNVETEGSGDVVTGDMLINCPAAVCSQLYDYDTSVDLIATPSTHWEFHTWQLDLTHQSSDTSITIDTTKFVRAIFVLMDYTVEVDLDGEGVVQSLPAGINCPSVCQYDYQYGTILALSVSPATGWTFSHWSGDLTGSEFNKNLTVDSDKSTTAHFIINTYNLNVQIEGNGSVSSSPSGINCPSACNHIYDHGTNVSLTANPDPGSEFVEWALDLSGSSINESILMTSSKNVKAIFDLISYTVNISIVGDGNVTTSDGNIDCPGDCSHVYYYNDNITLIATPGFEHHFVDWSGDISGSSTSKSITITESKNITATFEINEYTLTVYKNGEGNVSGSGIDCGSTCNNQYSYGTSVTITAESITGWYFSHWVVSNWSGSSSDLLEPTISFVIDEDREATAYFEIYTYELTTYVSGEGTITSGEGYINCGEGNTDCSREYDYGTSVTLTATPATGYYFDGWSGDITGTNTTESIIIYNDKSVTANFSIIQYTLTITKQGNGYIASTPLGIECGAVTDHPFLGTISNTLCQIEFDYYTNVTLDATADVGYALDSAVGDYQSIDTNNEVVNVLMDQNKSIELIFIQTEFMLEVRNMITDQHGTVISDISSCIDCDHQYGMPLPEGCYCEIPRNYNIELASNADEFYRLEKWKLEDVTIIKIGNGYGSIYAVRYDNYLHITPDPHPGYVFCGWIGDYNAILSDDIVEVEINQGNVIYVCFSTDERLLTVVKTGDVDFAYVVSEPGGIYYGNINQHTFTVASQVSLIVHLDSSSEIQSVSGPYDYIDDNVIYVTMDEHKEITIEITKSCYDLELVNMVSDKHGDIYSYPVCIDCGDTCICCMAKDNNVELAAVPEENYQLKAWRFEDVTIYKEGYGYGVIYIDQQINKIYITPDAHPGYVFCGWTGDYDNVDANNVAEVTTQQGKIVYCCFAIPDRTLTVIKSGDTTADAYIISEPGGIYFGHIDNHAFDLGTQVILTVNLSSGSAIDFVNGDYDSINGNQIHVFMDDDKTVDISLKRTDVMLTLINLGDNDPNTTIYSQPEGIDCGSTCETYMPIDTGVELQTNSQSDKIITRWILEDITINRRGDGYGAIYTNKGGSILTIIPDPYPGYIFDGWTGDYDSITGNIVEVSIGTPKTVSCYFNIPRKTLTVNKINTNSGDAEIFSEPGSYNSNFNTQYDFKIGSVVYLIARRAANTSTVIWIGDYTDVEEDVIRIEMDTDKLIEVDFEVI